ncbi:UNVERIFIED_CONTAM: Kinesin light chain 3 [Siphonaria sp. JEL0065]|nr:Kinesin light chain 3 [Siphonaria sp. JEL0065]
MAASEHDLMALMMASMGFQVSTLEGTSDSVEQEALKALRNSINTNPIASPSIEVPAVTAVAAKDDLSRFTFSTNGLPFSHFKDIIEQWGGRDALIGLTTTDVNAKFLQPATKATGLSLCDQYIQTSKTSSLVKKSQWFVSHAWKYLFLDAFDAIENFLADQGLPIDTVVWFDLFCNSQHDTGSKPFSFWETTFMSAVQGNHFPSLKVQSDLKYVLEIQNVVIILQPWIDPIPFKRAWCIFEVYSSKKTNSNFQVAFTPKETKAFTEALLEHPDKFYNVLANVSCLKGEAFNPDDLIKIQTLIRETVGFVALDQMVLGIFCDWMVRQLNRGIEKAQKGRDSFEEMRWKSSLGHIHHLRGEYELGLPLLRDATAYNKANFGLNGLPYFVSLLNLGSLLDSAGNDEEAIEVLEQARQHVPRDYADFFGLYNNLGSAYRKVGNHVKSIEYAELALECSKTEPANSQSSLGALFNLGAAYSASGQKQKALPILLNCYELSKNTLGPDHPNTMGALNRLLEVQASLGIFNETLAVENFDRCRRLLGDTHPSTFSSRDVLAMIYRKQENFTELFAFQQETVVILKRVLGLSDSQTLKEQINLATNYAFADDLENAKATFDEYLRYSSGSGNEMFVAELVDFYLVVGMKLAATGKDALDYLEACVRLIREHPLRVSSDMAATGLRSYAQSLQKARQFTLAAEAFGESADIQSNIPGFDVNEILNNYSDAGDCFVAEGDFHEAEREYLSLYQHMAAVLPPTAPYFIDLAKEWAEKAQSDYSHLLWGLKKST